MIQTTAFGRPVRNAQPFTALHDAGISVKATITQSAPGAGRRIIVTSITLSIYTTSAPTATSNRTKLINGTSGGSDIRWAFGWGVPATAGYSFAHTANGWWEMDENTAATAEFATSVSSMGETISMSGFIVDVDPV